MDIYHTKKQAENIHRSCSYLILKTLFYFISQCTSEPNLESVFCKLDKGLDNCNFTFILLRHRPINKSNYEVCKYKTLGYTGLFSLHIELPRNMVIMRQFVCNHMLIAKVSALIARWWVRPQTHCRR